MFFTPNEVSYKVNEHLQIERIAKKLYSEFNDKEQDICLIFDFVKNSSQYDLIVIKTKAIIIIEAKGYEGIITGDENSSWKVNDSDNNERVLPKNPFRQVSDQRYNLMRYLNEKLPSVHRRFMGGISHIAAFICFKGDSYFDNDQIDLNKNMWFQVVNENNLAQALRSRTSEQFVFREIELKKLLRIMRVKEVKASEIIQELKLKEQKERIDIKAKKRAIAVKLRKKEEIEKKLKKKEEISSIEPEKDKEITEEVLEKDEEISSTGVNEIIDTISAELEMKQETTTELKEEEEITATELGEEEAISEEFLEKDDEISSTGLKKIIENIIARDITKNITPQNLSTFMTPETVIIFMERALESGLIEKIKDRQEYQIVDSWKEMVLKVEESDLEAEDSEKIYKKDFWMVPKEAESNNFYKGVFRGTKYRFNTKGEVWWSSGGKSSVKIKVKLTEEEDFQNIHNIKVLGGSFRITEQKEIIAKVLRKKGYEVIYIAKLKGEIELEGFKWQPSNLNPGDLWPSIYDGSQLSVNSNGEVFVRIEGAKLYAIEGHEELASKVLKLKRDGGRFKITENGDILTLIYDLPYPAAIRKQIENLEENEKRLIGIRKQTEEEGMIPIYVGKYEGKNIKFGKKFDLNAKWTEEDDKEFLSKLGL